nr:serine hydrolase [Symbiobacterium terraclitae]
MPVERVEPLLPDPPADLPDHWRGLHEVVHGVAREYPGRISVVAVDLTSGSRYEFRARDPYLPASTFKLPVALCTLEAIDRGELTWETPITYTEADWEPVGAGGFADAAFGTQWTVRNLVDRSIISSNNVAVKMLARTLTWDGLLACTTEMGGPVTRTEEGSTPVTAADEAAWWLRLWQLSRDRPELAEELLRPLRRVTYTGRIQAGTPRPELVTHKFGTYAGYDHDGAIVWGERPYVLVVMTFGDGGEYAADVAIERIAAAAWEAVTAMGSAK